MSAKIQIGTRVVFSRQFLRSISAFTGWHPFAKGEVTAIDDLGSIQLAVIKWDDGDSSSVNIGNLIPENRRHLEPQ